MSRRGERSEEGVEGKDCGNGQGSKNAKGVVQVFGIGKSRELQEGNEGVGVMGFEDVGVDLLEMWGGI